MISTKKSNTEKPKKKIGHIIGEELDIPTFAISGSHIELFGSNEAIVDGCKGVLEYSDGVIRLNTGKNILRFTGNDLIIKTFTMDQAVIQGDILSIDFST